MGFFLDLRVFNFYRVSFPEHSHRTDMGEESEFFSMKFLVFCLDSFNTSKGSPQGTLSAKCITLKIFKSILC